MLIRLAGGRARGVCEVRVKVNRGWVAIKVEEVLLPIFAAGLLNQREERLVWVIICDSWRWNQSITRDHWSIAALARAAKMDRGHGSRAMATLLDRGVVIQSSNLDDHKIRLAFNEHFGSWKACSFGTGRADSARAHSASKPCSFGTGRADSARAHSASKPCSFGTGGVLIRHQNRAHSARSLHYEPNHDTRTKPEARTTSAPDQKSGHARDPVWDAFADRYLAEYGEPAIPKRLYFFNLARWRKAGRDNSRMIEKVAWMFEWDLFGHTGRWTFEDFLAKYEKIPKPGESNGTPEKPTERIIREARERREREARLADAPRPSADRE